MLKHRLVATFGLLALLLLGRGALAIAYANACWNPAFNDPARVDISDIGDLAADTVLHSDAMEDVRNALAVVPRPTALVVVASASAIDDVSPRAHRPRGPPAA